MDDGMGESSVPELADPQSEQPKPTKPEESTVIEAEAGPSTG
jgi:hypothetical protein